MPQETPAEKELNWPAIAAQFAQGFLESGVPGLLRAWEAASIETHGEIHALSFDLTEDIALKVGELLHAVEEPFLPILAAFVAPILSGLFGAEFDAAEFHRRLHTGGGTRGAQSIIDGFMRAIVGDTPAEIVPSDAGAKRIAAAAIQASLETEFNALVPEVLSHLLPFDIGHWEDMTKLPEAIIRNLGVSRLVRRALQPIVTTCCTTPATWHMNKLHRPTLLGAGTLAKQIARNPEKREQWLEDLRREGFSEDRIEALLNEQSKFHSVSDVFRLQRAAVWTDDDAIRHLRDQGYQGDVATTELQLEKLKAIESFDRSMASTAVDAFADGRIDEATLGGFCSGTTISPQEKAQYVELAHTRRICGRRPLTPGEAAAAVEAGVLSFIDYRRALERDGRDDEAINVLELLLRAKLDAQKTAQQHRDELAAERAAEQAKRQAAALQKKAEHDAQLAAAARGRAADLEQAAIRGLIPIARVAEVWAADFDGETVEILTALLEDKRAAYVAQQAARDAAAGKAKQRGVDVGKLEDAVINGVITLTQYAQQLDRLNFTEEDARLLVATLDAKMRARADAQAAHAAAVEAGKVRHVDVHTLEILVRRGHRTMADFDAALRALDFDDAARAALRERLQIEIDEDATAAAARDAANAKLRDKGLSWDQQRRAVLLGVRTLDDAATFLLDNGFNADARDVLLAELRADVQEAEDARQRRESAAARVDARDAPLSDIARAARLGLIPVQTYLDRLARDKWSDEAIALETDLLLTEIADVQAARARRDELEAASHDRGLSLEQAARVVRAHLAPIAVYVSAAQAAGYSDDATALLARLLADEVAGDDAAAARRGTIAGELAGKALTLAQLESSVLAGLRTLQAFGDTVRSYGYSDEDAALLMALLQRRLEVQTAAVERKGTFAQEDAQRERERSTYEAAVLSGVRSVDDYAAWLDAGNYDPGDVALLVADVQQQLDTRGGA